MKTKNDDEHKHATGFRIDADIWQKLLKIQAEAGCTPSAYIRRVLRAHFENKQ